MGILQSLKSVVQLSGASTLSNTSETLTVSSTAGTLSDLGATVPASANGAYIVVEAAADGEGVRVWFDGSTPTSTNGNLATNGSSIEVDNRTELLRMELIRSDSNDATLQINYLE